MTDIIRNVTSTISEWDTFVLENGLQCDFFFEHCHFDWTAFNCCAAAVPLLHEKLGICYQFDWLPSNTTQRQQGPHSGLVVTLRIPETPQEFPLMSLFSGIIVEFGDDYRPPFCYGCHQIVSIPPNTTAQIQLSTQLVQRKSGVQRCLNHQPMCYKACFGKAVQRFCNCSLLGFKFGDPDEPHTCFPDQTYDCFEKFRNQSAKFRSECMEQNCLPACEEWLYLDHVTYMAIKTDAIKKFYNGKLILSQILSEIINFFKSKFVFTCTFDIFKQ